MKGVVMRTTPFAAIAAIFSGMLFLGCAATQSTVPVSDPAKPLEVGRFSFLAPPGEGWEYLRISAPPVESVLFMKRGAVKPQGFIAAVSQVRTDNPVTSEKELSDKILQIYHEEVDTEGRYEILASKCDHDETFSKMGVLCFGEVKDHPMTGMEPVEPIIIRGHGYAFAHPDDNRIVGVVEFYERGLSERLSADTRTMLGEFARGITLR